MLRLSEVRCRSIDLDHLWLSWEVGGVSSEFGDSSEDPRDYDIYIERSDSPGGAFETITPQPLVDTYTFVDTQRGLLHSWRKLYYRLRVVNRQTGETGYAPERVPASLSAQPPLDALEMARQELVQLKEFTGRQCWLLKKRTFGMRCPECWDWVTARRMKSNCLSCFGTGFLGGYHQPIRFWLQVDPAEDTQQNISPVGSTEQQITTARTIFFPPIDPHDVIVEAENKRWRVSSRSNTERVRAVVKQTVQMVKIPAGDVEFRIPIDIAALEIDPTAVRQFSNPTTPSVNMGSWGGLFSRLGVSE